MLAAWGLRAAHRSGASFMFAVLYAGVIGGYAVLASDDLELRVVIASAAKLSLPIVLVAAGYGSLETPRRLGLYTLILAAIAGASTAFGAWDVGQTQFWTETLQYGHYLNGVKGIISGFDSYYVLPFNFFGYEGERRAGGLVAAPLAQGSMVAIGAMLGFAVLQRKAFWLALGVLLVGMIGVWQSGTRGAMLILLIAVPVFLVLSGRGGTMARNLVMLAALIAGTYQTLQFVYSYSANFEDGSTIGHFEALQRNLEELGDVAIVGPGIGASGSVAADEGLEMAGGGEGSIFAIAYQIGVPGAVIFLCYYAAILRKTLQARRLGGATGDIASAVFALGIGIITTLISSDHIFSLSGMGIFWIVLGGLWPRRIGPRLCAHDPRLDGPLRVQAAIEWRCPPHGRLGPGFERSWRHCPDHPGPAFNGRSGAGLRGGWGRVQNLVRADATLRCRPCPWGANSDFHTGLASGPIAGQAGGVHAALLLSRRRLAKPDEQALVGLGGLNVHRFITPMPSSCCIPVGAKA